MPQPPEECRAQCLSFAGPEMMTAASECYELQTEYNRCRFERLTCDQLLDPEYAEAGPEPLESPCREPYEVWWACVDT